MATKADVQKILDVLVSALRLVPENNIRYADQNACLDEYLTAIRKQFIAKQLPPALYDTAFFTQIFHTAFQKKHPAKNYMRFYIVPKDYNPTDRFDLRVAKPGFYIDLDKLAQNIHNKYELPSSDVLLVAYHRRKSTVGSMKLEHYINISLRPYYQNTPDLLLGMLVAILKMLISAIFFLVALLIFAVLLPATVTALVPTASAGFIFGSLLLLIAGGIGSVISGCCFFSESVQALTSAYSDTFDNHIKTNIDLPPPAEEINQQEHDIEQIFTQYGLR